MKTLTLLFLSICILVFSAFGESYRKTTAEMQAVQYGPALSNAAVRAEQHKALYERCDAHHNCGWIAEAESCDPEVFPMPFPRLMG